MNGVKDQIKIYDSCPDCKNVVHLYGKCSYKPLPTTSAMVPHAVKKQRGVVRVVADDVKKAVNNVSLRLYFGTGSLISNTLNISKNIVLDSLRGIRWWVTHPPVMLVDLVCIISVFTIIGALLPAWWLGFFSNWPKTSPRERMIELQDNAVVKLKTSCKDYIQSVTDRAKEEIE